MTQSSPMKSIVRNICTTITIIGVCLLGIVFLDFYEGRLAAKYFSGIELLAHHHIYGLLLALPVPLHVIFIGLIIQKKWLSDNMGRFAWVGITASGVWLGVALVLRLFVL